MIRTVLFNWIVNHDEQIPARGRKEGTYFGGIPARAKNPNANAKTRHYATISRYTARLIAQLTVCTGTRRYECMYTQTRTHACTQAHTHVHTETIEVVKTLTELLAYFSRSGGKAVSKAARS